MSNFYEVVRGVMGWGLLTLVLALSGAFSTTLNGLQLLNGLFCFARVPTTTSVNDSDVSLFSSSGYGNNHFFNIQDEACSGNLTHFIQGEQFPYCNGFFDVGPLGRFRCTQNITQSRVIYKYILDVDCTKNSSRNGHSFEMSVSPGSSSLRGVVGIVTGYTALSSVEVQRCQLGKPFYILFSVVCVSITLLIFLARALMRTALVEPVSFRLSNSERFYWLYEAFERYGFFSFFNPYKNEPYHLIRGEKFYKMVPVPPSSEGSLNPATGRVDEPCLESFTWSTSDSVYKFSYDVVGNTVFAYSKDKLGFEKLKEKETDRRVVAEIRKYLRLKAESVCILTNGVNICRRHFLSLGEVYGLAKVDYRLEEEISDNDYRLYSKQQDFTPIKPGESSRESPHLIRENSDIPLRPRNSFPSTNGASP